MKRIASTTINHKALRDIFQSKPGSLWLYMIADSIYYLADKDGWYLSDDEGVEYIARSLFMEPNSVHQSLPFMESMGLIKRHPIYENMIGVTDRWMNTVYGEGGSK